MSSQEAFLARIRRALHKEASPPALHPPLLWKERPLAAEAAALQARLAAQRPALIARVQDELTAVSGVVAQVQSIAAATQYVARLAQDKGAECVVRWQSPLLDLLEVDAALQQQGVAVHTTVPPDDGAAGVGAMEAKRRELRELLARAELGLSGVDYVIAETGTLVLSAAAGQMRGVSLLPPVHVAVARTTQVLATLADYLTLLQASGGDLQQALTSCVSFVTGPSRTGDIELKLSVGVHGPCELHLVLLDDPAA